MNTSQITAACRPLGWLAMTIGTLTLTACGGGSEPEKSYFAVQGARGAGNAVATVCIENAAYTDPASTAGQKVANTLASYYGITGAWRSYAGTGSSCREKFTVVDVLLSVDEYNKVVVPAVQAPPPVGSTPAPAPAPTPTPSPSPSPTPAPPAIACTSGAGAGSNGLALYGQSRVGALTAAAGQDTTVALDPGEVTYLNAGLSSTATTGTLRARLWAVPQSYAGGSITGYVVATYDIAFSDGTNFLRNGESSDLSERTLAARTPPAGAYCMVVTLEQFDSRNCSTTDRYCTADWLQFGPSSSFR